MSARGADFIGVGDHEARCVGYVDEVARPQFAVYVGCGSSSHGVGGFGLSAGVVLQGRVFRAGVSLSEVLGSGGLAERSKAAAY